MNKLTKAWKTRILWLRYQKALRAYRTANARAEELLQHDQWRDWPGEVDLDPSQWRELPASLRRDVTEG